MCHILQKYVDTLRAKGCGARSFDTYKYHNARRLQESAEAGVDDRGGDDASGSDEEADELVCVNQAIDTCCLDEDGYYQPQSRILLLPGSRHVLHHLKTNWKLPMILMRVLMKRGGENAKTC